jgi:S-adenosylmethionine synthetase
VLDECLKQDPESKVACECAFKNDTCMIFGEYKTNAKISFEQIARQAIKEAGYDDTKKSLDYKTANIFIAMDK